MLTGDGQAEYWRQDAQDTATLQRQLAEIDQRLKERPEDPNLLDARRQILDKLHVRELAELARELGRKQELAIKTDAPRETAAADSVDANRPSWWNDPLDKQLLTVREPTGHKGVPAPAWVKRLVSRF
jgi:hypothetical protein